jgi:hypothetical protein
MADIAARIQSLYSAAPNQTTYWSHDKKRKVYIRDMEVNDADQHLWLLLYSNDAEATGASFAHLQTDKHRYEDKQEGEGRPESAHLLISLADPQPGSSRYLALLEEAPTLPRARVERYLCSLLRNARKADPEVFKYPAPTGERDRSGAPKMLPYSNKISLIGHLSADFQTDLENGALRGISLETTAKQHFGFGEGARLEPVRKNIKLGTRDTWGEDPLSIVKDALSLGKKNKYEAARIVFQSADETTHTALLDTETGGVLNEGYIKKVRLTAKDVFLPDASTSLVEVLKTRMAALFSAHNAHENGN